MKSQRAGTLGRTAGALALAPGIAIRNIPEGAIISMPLRAEGMSKGKTFLSGVLSGAMMYVVVEELVPEMAEGEHSNLGTIAFSVGFVLMMVLDVALG